MSKRYYPILLLLLSLYSQLANAGLLSVFKYEDGRTNWQYIANGGGGFLILLLTITAITLLISRRKLRQSNKELTQIRAELEQRVEERTATLNDANLRLQAEIEKHKQTTEQLRASESYIKNVLESMPLTLIGLDKNGTITQWNKQAQQTSGIAPEHALGKNLWKTFHSIYVSAERVQEAISTNKPINYRHNDRGRGHYEVIVYPLSGPTNTEVVILIDDVTKQVESENQLIQRDKMSSMGELASAMAHDINIPLNAIIKDITHIQHHLKNALQPGEVLQEEAIQPINTLLIESIEKGQQAAGIIDNLIAFSRLHNTAKQPALMTELMDHTLELASEMLAPPEGMQFKNIRIVKDYQQALQPLPCLAAELQQVFLSTLRHAFYAMKKVEQDDYEPTIKIQIMECYDYLWVRIQHNGRGLTVQEQLSIFEPFFGTETRQEQYDASKRLSFPYFIVTEHHEGQMAVTSDVDVGTTFHMQFPML
ncbi:MAG: PAS domain S-box protein [Oleiphilaceae bacterium]|nr:PAS domain S-box protein [Oleiphilaceae bacterium]